jgi:kynurenine formamidase
MTSIDVTSSPTRDGRLSAVPSFDELPTVGDTGERASWGVFGPSDEFGCLNFQTAQTVRRGSEEVALGRVVNLNVPLGEPQPQFWASRTKPEQRITVGKTVRDEYIDNFNTQVSSQIDGFAHHRFRAFGYYGGRQDEDLDQHGALSMHRWAERGIVGRGILADVEAHVLQSTGESITQQRLAIGPELIAATLEAQGTVLEPGDMLLVRTGWLGWYRGLAPGVRQDLADRWTADRKLATLPGISPSIDAARWLWNSQVSLLALDNPTAEAVPYRREEGWAHHRLLVLLGLPLGELWELDALGQVCAEAGRWSFLVTAAPLNMHGSVASPSNAYAVL